MPGNGPAARGVHGVRLYRQLDAVMPLFVVEDDRHRRRRPVEPAVGQLHRLFDIARNVGGQGDHRRVIAERSDRETKADGLRTERPVAVGAHPGHEFGEAAVRGMHGGREGWESSRAVVKLDVLPRLPGRDSEGSEPSGWFIAGCRTGDPASKIRPSRQGGVAPKPVMPGDG